MENLPNRISASGQMREFGNQLRHVIKGVAALGTGHGNQGPAGISNSSTRSATMSGKS